MPAFSDNPDPSVIRFLPDPAKADDPHIGELLKGIAANIKEMEERNRDLEEQNNQLLAALRHAHERIHAFEHASVANPELTRLALTTAAQLIESARESIEAAQKAVKESNADIYEKTIDQVIDYEKRSLTLLENARREADRRKQEVEHNAMEVFLQARDSVLSMARDLETTEGGLDPDRIESVMESSLTHSGHDKFNEVERLEPSGHSIELTASPFRTFAAISAFHKSILRLPGITAVKVSGFDKDRIVMAIKHAGSLPLVGALMEMDGFDLQLVSFTPDRIEFRIKNDGLAGTPAIGNTDSL